MKYRKPTSPVFWVPVPDNGQSRVDLIDHKLDPNKQPQQMTLTDPETGDDYTVEILDYLGAYHMEKIPDFMAAQIINKDTTGAMLKRLLRSRIPDFAACNKVLFYLVNPLVKNEISFLDLAAEHSNWSLKTFSEATAQSSIEKLKEETKEIEADIANGIKNPIEYADALMCLLDSAWRNEISAIEILKSFSEKLKINKERKWKKNPDNSYSHI